MGDRLIIGIGNPDRGDDAVSSVVVRLLRERTPADVRLVEAITLMVLPDGAQHLWLIDAAQSGSPPGTIHRIDCTTDAPMPRSSISSHGLGVADAISLARNLRTLPPYCIVYAIEAAQFDPGAPLSPAVAQAAREVADAILAELTRPPPSVRRQQHRAPGTGRR